MHRLNEHLIQYIESSDEAYATDEDFALKDRKAIKDNIKKTFKDVDKTRNEFIKTNHKKDGHVTMKTKEFKKMHLDEGLFDNPSVTPDFWYPKNRGPLVDIITANLTGDEIVYRRHETDNPDKPKFVVQATGLGFDNEDISVDSGDEDNRPTIKVRVKNDADAEQVVALADRYDKISNVKPIRFYGDKKFEVTIYIDEEDFEGNYIEDNINVRPDNRGRKSSSEKVLVSV